MSAAIPAVLAFQGIGNVPQSLSHHGLAFVQLAAAMFARYLRLGAVVAFCLCALIYSHFQHTSGTLHLQHDIGLLQKQQELFGEAAALYATVNNTGITTSSAIVTASTIPSPASNAASIISSSPFAYVFYATHNEYACSTIVNIHRLRNEFHTSHQIVVFASYNVSRPFTRALEALNATVIKEQPPPMSDDAVPYYEYCLLKLYGFKMHAYKPKLQRVLIMDGDQLILRNLDHVFSETADATIAAPRAYWLNATTEIFTSAFMLVRTGQDVWNAVDAEIMERPGAGMYDMDIVNKVFRDEVLYLGGEYATLNSHWEDWNLPGWWRNSTKSGDVIAQAATGTISPSAESSLHFRRDLANEDELFELQRQQAATASADTSRTSSPASPTFLHGDISWIPTPTPTLLHELLAPSALSQHPLYQPLIDFYDAPYVLHFSAVGKPWMYPVEEVIGEKSHAHPFLVEQWRTWRTEAKKYCPVVQYPVGIDLLEYRVVGEI